MSSATADWAVGQWVWLTTRSGPYLARVISRDDSGYTMQGPREADPMFQVGSTGRIGGTDE